MPTPFEYTDKNVVLNRLLKLHEVKRLGAGGRGDPYIYMVIIVLGNNLIQSIDNVRKPNCIWVWFDLPCCFCR